MIELVTPLTSGEGDTIFIMPNVGKPIISVTKALMY